MKPHFQEPYLRARRSYALVSGLLLAWELVGISLGDSPFENINVSLRNPDATPFILTVLVIYFAYRFTIEWHQSDMERRCTTVSRIDFIVAHILGLLAISTYLVQQTLDFRVFEFLVDIFPELDVLFNKEVGFILLVTILISSTLGIIKRRRFRDKNILYTHNKQILFTLTISILFLAIQIKYEIKPIIILATLIISYISYILIVKFGQQNSKEQLMGPE